jgi:hypothetical protein
LAHVTAEARHTARRAMGYSAVNELESSGTVQYVIEERAA